MCTDCTVFFKVLPIVPLLLYRTMYVDYGDTEEKCFSCGKRQVHQRGLTLRPTMYYFVGLWREGIQQNEIGALSVPKK